MPTGDGLLVRFLPADHIAVPAFIALCDAARRHGNGTIEISARGSVQVRGLCERSAAAFARDVEALAIPAADGVPIFVDPLPEDPNCLVDATRLASKLRPHIARAGLALGPKICITIDGGGRVHLDAVSADVRLRAVSVEAGRRLQVAIAGDARSAIPLGLVRLDEVSEIIVRLLAIIAKHGPPARANDCIRALRKAVAQTCSDEPHQFRARLPAEPVGVHALRDKQLALGVAPTFGHAHAKAFIQLAHIAGAHGATSLRPAPGRALLLINAARAQVHELAREANACGFIVRADDPRRRVIACAGSPACASGFIPARTLAAEIAAHARDVQDTIHISGCAKGCAHPASAALTIVGTEQGCGIVRHGTARVAPSRYVNTAELINEIVQEVQLSAGQHTHAGSLSHWERGGVRG
jgi:precorrin-3B synthase